MQPDKNAVAYRAWLEYYVRTEAFDRTLPGGFSKQDPDTWMVIGHARRESNTYASHVRHALSETIGIGNGSEGRRSVERLTYSRQVKEIERMDRHCPHARAQLGKMFVLLDARPEPTRKLFDLLALL